MYVRLSFAPGKKVHLFHCAPCPAHTFHLTLGPGKSKYVLTLDQVILCGETTSNMNHREE